MFHFAEKIVYKDRITVNKPYCEIYHTVWKPIEMDVQNYSV